MFRKRPVCLFALCMVMVLLLWTSLPGGMMNKNRKPRDNCLYKVQFAGLLEQKEMRNGHLIFYLSQVSFLGNSTPPNIDSIYYPSEKSSKKQYQVICYLQDTQTNQDLYKVPLGAHLLMEGKFAFFSGAENEGQFDSQRYYAVRGYAGRIVSARLLNYDMKKDILRERLYALREKIKDFFFQHMDAQNAGTLSAMLLGDKTSMDTEIKDLYRSSGIAHILAISGLHMSFLGLCIYKLLRRCLVPLYLRGAISLFCLYIYSVMIQAGSSAKRAFIMLFLYIAADLLQRSYDTYTALSIAAILMLFENPLWICDGGFLLSFSAMLGLFLINPVLQRSFGIAQKRKGMYVVNAAENRWERIKEKGKERIVESFMKLWNSLWTSISVTLMTLPVMLWFYFEFAPYGIFLNLLVLPLMSIILVLGIVGGMGRLALTLAPVEVILHFYTELCTFADSLPGHCLVTGRPCLWQLVIYYMLLLGVLIWDYICQRNEKKDKQKDSSSKDSRILKIFLGGQAFGRQSFGKLVLGRIVLATCLCLAVGTLCVPMRRGTAVDMLSVGQGDCIVLRDGKTAVLIDGGSSDVSEIAKNRIVPYLKYHGITCIEAALLSHAHIDHKSGLEELLEHEKEFGIKIQMVCTSKLAEGNNELERIRWLCKQRNIDMCYLKKGDLLEKENMSFRVLYPSGQEQIADENDTSMVLFAKLYDKTLLFTGDATSQTDKMLILALRENQINQVAVYKAEHHGSAMSNSNSLLQEIRPSASIISCGQGNSYGHPHAETMERLRQIGSNIYVTKDMGQIQIEFTKKGEQIHTFLYEFE